MIFYFDMKLFRPAWWSWCWFHSGVIIGKYWATGKDLLIFIYEHPAIVQDRVDLLLDIQSPSDTFKYFWKASFTSLFQGTDISTGLKMFLLNPFMGFIFIAIFHDMGEAVPKDVHIHLHGLNKELAKAGAGGGMLGWF